MEKGRVQTERTVCFILYAHVVFITFFTPVRNNIEMSHSIFYTFILSYFLSISNIPTFQTTLIAVSHLKASEHLISMWGHGVPPAPTSSSLDTNWVSYNSTQFWHYWKLINRKHLKRNGKALALNFNYITNSKRHILHLQQEESYYFTTQQEEGRLSPCPATALPMRLSQLSQ